MNKFTNFYSLSSSNRIKKREILKNKKTNFLPKLSLSYHSGSTYKYLSYFKSNFVFQFRCFAEINRVVHERARFCIVTQRGVGGDCSNNSKIVASEVNNKPPLKELLEPVIVRIA